jgi:hypothetical protein
MSPELPSLHKGSIFKQFRITDGNQLQFRAETFNLTNTPSFGISKANVDTGTAGRATSKFSAPRQIQFALKYDF